jgi:hypothetical protein
MSPTLIYFVSGRFNTVMKNIVYKVQTISVLQEIPHEPGFEYPQTFSKFFAKKVDISQSLYRIG